MMRGLVADQIATAVQKCGFFYVINHDISDEEADSADQAMREFFRLPAEAKEAIAADKTRALKTGRGYAGLRAEQLDVSVSGRPDLKEVLDLGLSLGDSTQTYLGSNPWPKAMPHLQNATEPYLRSALSVGKELLAAVARSLGLSEGIFEEIFDEPLVVQRLMHYPPRRHIDDMKATNTTQDDSGEFGCGAHYDFGGLTLLRQADAPGLQVQPPMQQCSAGDCTKVPGGFYGTTRGTFYSDLQNTHAAEWMDVEARSKALVVTFGEALQRLTNGKVQATRHRVVHKGSTGRHSMAVFIDPNPHREVTPLTQLVDVQPKYESRIAGHKTVLLAATAAFSHRSGGSFGSYLGFGKV
jgi:isopenicillin N synthase-like dioxygenase